MKTGSKYKQKIKTILVDALSHILKIIQPSYEIIHVPPHHELLFLPPGSKILPIGFDAVLGPLTYNQDGLATVHDCSFMQDPNFIKAYETGKSLGSWHPLDVHWRAYVLCWAAEKGKNLEGDFIECGVHKGSSAMTVAMYVGFEALQKTFYLLDTYHGLDERYVTDEEKSLGAPIAAFKDDYYDFVKNSFSRFQNMEIIKGSVPETLPMVKSKKVAYLALDMNNAAPEVAAAEFFWEKLVSGAVIVLDDYGWSGYHTIQKRAADEFAARKGVRVLSLPTGQGLIIKP